MGERHNIHGVLNAIEHGRRFLVSAHARPDGDAVGSMLACAMILEQLGKQVDMISCDRVPLIYRSLPCASAIRQVSRVDDDYDVVILLECDGLERSRLRGLDGRFLSISIIMSAGGPSLTSTGSTRKPVLWRR